MAPPTSIDDQAIAATFFGEGKWLTDFVTPDALEVQELYHVQTEGMEFLEPKLLACWEWVACQVKYVSFVKAKLSIDGHTSIQSDYWQSPSQVIRTKIGNCLAEGTKVLTVNPQGYYEIRAIEDLRNYEGYSVVSYNSQIQKLEHKPITNWFNNGVKEVVKTKFNNGEAVLSTPDHLFLQESGNYSAQYAPISNILSNGNRSALMVRRLTPLSRHPCPKPGYKYTYEHLWVVGHYLAEGNTGREGKVVICNDDPEWREKLHQHLNELKVPYSTTDLTHSNYTRILHKKEGTKKDGINHLKENLRELGHIAPEKGLTNDFLSLGRPQLRAIMDGYSAGDSYLPCKIKKHRKFTSRHMGRYRYKTYYFLQHGTTSEKLADQLKLIHLILGRPLWSNLGKGSGAGKNPLSVYRLNEYLQASYKGACSQRDLGVVDILSSEDTLKLPVYDIEVADNHNFMLANGIIVHNCANKAFLLASLVRQELSAAQVNVVLGNLHQPDGPGGHAWVEIIYNSHSFIMEATRGDMRPMIATDVAEIYEPIIYFNDVTVKAIQDKAAITPFKAVYADWLRDYLDWAFIEGRK